MEGGCDRKNTYQSPERKINGDGECRWEGCGGSGKQAAQTDVNFIKKYFSNEKRSESSGEKNAANYETL